MSGIVEDILRQNDIPFLKQGTLGEAITSRVGYGTESYNFFIPFGAMIKAKELLADIFCAETDGAH